MSRLEALTNKIEVALGSGGRERGISGKDFACKARYVYPVVTYSVYKGFVGGITKGTGYGVGEDSVFYIAHGT